MSTIVAGHAVEVASAPKKGGGWRDLPHAAQTYVTVVIAGGISVFAAYLPLAYPQPVLFATLLALTCLTSAWKVTLPIAVTNGSTLSVSYAANLMALILLGPQHAVFIAVIGAWMQCTVNVRHPYPLHRTVFSISAEAITMAVTALVYEALGGSSGVFDVSWWTRPFVGAASAYFVFNTGLVAAAIALSTGRRLFNVWRDDFLWSAVSFMVTGSAGAIAAVVVGRGEQWKAAFLAVPVYLTYRTYQLFVRRLEDEQTRTCALADEKGVLLEANHLKDQFLATVSHELRTPLNAILGWADMLRSGSLDDARRDRACQAIYSSAKRQAQLIDELLDVSRIVSRKLPLEFLPIDLKDIIRGALEVVQPSADAKRIALDFDDDLLFSIVFGDSGRLQQVVSNLLTNAIKFTPEGGSIHVRLRPAGDCAELIVSDTGQGIPLDFLPSVFEPFRQADGTTTRLHGGLGLGLSIVKHLVEAHHGTVRAESGGEGRGATFTVLLPIAHTSMDQCAAVAHDHPSQAERVADTPDSLAGLAVLIVDDDAENRLVVQAHLESHGAQVLSAASAAEALRVIQRERVDVLLADLAMPGEDGYTLIRKLRAQPSARTASIPAAALTAFARAEDRQHALQAGFQLHLSKPVDPRSLVAAVAKLGRATIM